MEYEYPTVPMTSKDVREIVKEIDCEISCGKSDELLWALNNVKLDLEKFSTPHEEREKLKKLKITLERLLMEVDPFTNPSLVSAGEEFAKRYGPHPGSSIQSEAVLDYYTREVVDDEVLTYGTFETTPRSREFNHWPPELDIARVSVCPKSS